VKHFTVVLRITFVIMLVAPFVDAANWILLRRTAQVVACLASAADGYSTAVATNAGAREGNPLLSNSRGTVSYPKLITLKSVMCAAPIVLSETLHRYKQDRRVDYAGVGGSAMLTGLYSWAAWHNYGVADQLRKQRDAAALLK
jgi:hypothetical protein